MSDIHHRDYGMGACAGDIDNDGLTDLYITNVGPNALYRNTGGGQVCRGTQSRRRQFAAVEHQLRVRRHRSRRRPRPVRHQLRRHLAKRSSTDPQGRNEFCGIAGPPAIRDYCHPLIYPPLTSNCIAIPGRRSKTSASAAASSRIAATASASPSSDIDDDGCPTCSSPTTASPTSCSTTGETAPSPKSPASPASR